VNHLNNSGNPIAGCLGSIISVGVIFASLNVALYACQEEAAKEFKQPYQEKKELLENLRKQLSVCTKELSLFKAQAVDNALPPNIYDRYKDTLELCNKNVREHNLLVPQVNELSRKVNQRIYILPIPGRSGESVHSR
jgi:hypothetical protein